MIVFYTRFNVRDDFNHQSMLNMAFDVVNGMKNIPDSFTNHHWDGSESAEWKEGRNLLSYEIDSDSKKMAFRVAIVDENDELWTTDIALNDNNHDIQLRLARERKHASAEYNNSFRLPYLFKKIIRDGKAETDHSLSVTDKPIYITNDNISIIADVINGKSKYTLPVIYVSHPFLSEDYSLDVNELAKDMAGSAHVIVELSSDTSSVLKTITDSRNAYDGAIDIFFSNDSFRYIRWAETTANQFRYKVSHAVYTRMAMRNIDEDSSLSALKIRNKLKLIEKSGHHELEIEKLKEKNNYLQELYDTASELNSGLEKDLQALENKNRELENKNRALSAALSRKKENEEKCIQLAFSEDEFYDEEIKHFVLECIKKSIGQYGDDEKNRRDYHILSDIVQLNDAANIAEGIKTDILNTFRKGKLSGADNKALQDIGFVLQKGSHDKYVFHDDDRYIVTVSKTPSDHREGENVAHDAIKLIFGRY